MQYFKQVFWILCTILLVSIAIATPYTIDGENVYVDDENIYLNTYPHTILVPQWVYLNFTPKQYSGDIDMAFGFNTQSVIPRRAELYRPQTEWNETYEKEYNFVNYAVVTNLSCDVGNEYNDIKREINWNYTTTYLNNESQNITIIANQSEVACFDSFVNDAGVYTITWRTEETGLKEWIDVTSKFNSADFTFEDTNKWYYVKNISVENMTNYRLRFWLDLPTYPISGKYYVAMKLTKDTLNEAVSNNRFYFLDPWYEGVNYTYVEEGDFDPKSVGQAWNTFNNQSQLDDGDWDSYAVGSGDAEALLNFTKPVGMGNIVAVKIEYKDSGTRTNFTLTDDHLSRVNDTGIVQMKFFSTSTARAIISIWNETAGAYDQLRNYQSNGWIYEVAVWFGAENITIPDAKPTILDVNITPTTAYNDDDLVCNVTAFDTANSTLQIEYYWYNGTTLIENGNTTVTGGITQQVDILGAGNLTTNTIYNCTVRAWDGLNWSISFNSTTLQISNRLPSVENVSITPSPASTLDNLTCNYDYTDEDSNPEVASYFRWFKDSINQNISLSIVGSGNTSAGESWYCGVKVNDGFDNSTIWVNSSIVVINDSIAPVLSNLSLSATSGTRDVAFTITAYCEDASSGIATGYPIVEILDPNTARTNFTMTVVSGYHYTKSYTPATVGGYYFKFFCKDQSGNLATNSSTGLSFTATAPVQPAGGGGGGGVSEVQVVSGANITIQTRPSDIADLLVGAGDETQFTINVVSTGSTNTVLRMSVTDNCNIYDTYDVDGKPPTDVVLLEPFEGVKYNLHFKVPDDYEVDKCNVFVTFTKSDGAEKTVQIRVWNTFWSNLLRVSLKTITYPIVFEKDADFEFLSSNALITIPAFVNLRIPFVGFAFIGMAFYLTYVYGRKYIVELRSRNKRTQLLLLSLGASLVMAFLISLPIWLM